MQDKQWYCLVTASKSMLNLELKSLAHSNMRERLGIVEEIEQPG